MIYNVDDFPQPASLLAGRKLQKGKVGNQGTKQQRKYIDVLTAFDIETSPCPELTGNAMMYVWQWCFFYPDKPDDYVVIIGRTWEQLLEFIRDLMPPINDYGTDASLVILVHNLSYEFQFMRSLFSIPVMNRFSMQKPPVSEDTGGQFKSENYCRQIKD